MSPGNTRSELIQATRDAIRDVGMGDPVAGWAVMKRRGLAIGCLVWAAVGLAIASMVLGAVNRDARLLAFASTAVGVGSALFAAVLLLRGRPRWAGSCLVVSIIIPTGFAAALNLVPLTVGLILLWTGGPERRSATTGSQAVAVEAE